jgi:hypothetical protein
MAGTCDIPERLLATIDARTLCRETKCETDMDADTCTATYPTSDADICRAATVVILAKRYAVAARIMIKRPAPVGMTCQQHEVRVVDLGGAPLST